jgi:hypothetical protein
MHAVADRQSNSGGCIRSQSGRVMASGVGYRYSRGAKVIEVALQEKWNQDKWDKVGFWFAVRVMQSGI